MNTFLPFREWIKPAAAGCVLLLPLWYTGFFGVSPPLLPPALAQIFRATGVFEQAPSAQSEFFTEIRRSPDSPWIRWNSDSLFAARPWGGKSRFQDLVQALQAKNGARGKEELAQWILHRIPDMDTQSELRFVREAHPLTGSSTPAAGAGPEPVSVHRMNLPKSNP